MLAVTCLFAATPQASAETRSLKLYFTHTREKAEIAYKRNGRYLPDGLQKINRILRDWRRNEPTKMDPQLLDLIWEVYRAAGGRDYIHVVSAYRSPATNSMLRKRSNGVAEKSQHMLGKAMDFYIPGVKLSKLRAAALQMQGGGVGYYPSSGSPFVHVDVGNVRHWPRMNRQQLMAVFPGGKTLHVPTDGKPLPGYEQALASYKSRKKSGSVAVASAGSGGGRGFFSALFGGGADDAEDSEAIALASAPSTTASSGPRRGAASKAEAPRGDDTLPGLAPAASVPEAQPERETPETIIAALPPREVPLPVLAPRPQVGIGDSALAALAPTGEAAAMAAPVEVAANVPLPSRRPSYAPAAVEPAADEMATIIARAESATGQAMPESALAPTARPAQGSAAIAQAMGVVPVPGGKPETAEKNVVLAALPQQRSASDAATGDWAPQAAARPRLGTRVAAASPRAALLGAADDNARAKALSSGVKTTEKSARPGRGDAVPDPQPVVLPSEPDAARWAFQKDLVTITPTGTTAPSFAYNTVRTAPRAVYTAGFRQDASAPDPNRFTGQAVTFLSVAKFN